jgi:phosphoribosylaminoimidazole-succinocarboxamide synthase
LNDLDLLVEAKGWSRSEAATWLINEGRIARRLDFEKMRQVNGEIKRLRASMPILSETSLDLPLLARGKVRDVYDLGDKLLIVATDRLSAFDVVLPTAIPDKGAVLTQMSAFWFEKTGDIVPNHFIRVVESTRVPEVPVELPREMIGRSMVVRKAERIDVECVVRGYITGSGWADYQKAGAVSGIKLPEGLEESQELHDPIFTPTTKASEGHDMPITYRDVKELAGDQAANAMRVRALAVYRFGRDYARERGIIIADTKFEFGILDDEVILIDEALTPDSSRFWPEDQYVVGQSPPSFDKQYVRDYLSQRGWDKTPPGPELPPEVVEKTAEKYREAFERITGRTLVLP